MTILTQSDVASASNQSRILAVGIALVTLAGFAFIGHSSIGDLIEDDAPLLIPELSDRPYFAVFGLILARNVPIALLLFSGTMTGALSTLVSCMLLGVYFGATFTVAAERVGASEVFGSVAAYAPVEALGFVMAATSGFLPISRVLVRRRSDARAGAGLSLFRQYTDELPAALTLLGSSVALLVLGGAVEAAVIVSR